LYSVVVVGSIVTPLWSTAPRCQSAVPDAAGAAAQQPLHQLKAKAAARVTEINRGLLLAIMTTPLGSLRRPGKRAAALLGVWNWWHPSGASGDFGADGPASATPAMFGRRKDAVNGLNDHL
jgi:hypothetical protein